VGEEGRYSRQVALPEVGVEGQRRLGEARVLVVGAGGLGAPVLTYLAAAGVGTLGIVDSDCVETSNLHRQVLFDTADVGAAKTEAAARRILRLNPGVRVQTHPVRLTSANAVAILQGYDIVVDATDNFPSRYLLSDACAARGVPDVYGSISRFDGQVSVFCHAGGPCYRCLFPEPPAEGVVPSCDEGGVIGVLPGIIGTIQAAEAIKLIIGRGSPLSGRILLFDALGMSFRELRVERSPGCPACGARRGEGNTAGRGDESPGEVSVRELQECLAAGDRPVILDVREEPQAAAIPGSVLLPLRELSARLGELDRTRRIITICRTGRRSLQAARILLDSGFTDVVILRGGWEAWSSVAGPSPGAGPGLG
jgi:sulfur-carrier protein adenylyltransferase/sulfurtransferase